MPPDAQDGIGKIPRREFLRWLGMGTGVAAADLGVPLRLLAAVNPAQNSRASALGKRSKGPISAAMMQAQTSSMPGTVFSNSVMARNGSERLAKVMSRRSRSRCRSRSARV